MKKILIIDDDLAVRAALSKLLKIEGYETVLAADFDEALAHFDDEKVDLLLLDLNMPAKSGWELFERFTGIDPLVPIIVITGRADQGPLASAAGVSALFEKPIDVDVLLQSIRELVAESNEARLRRLMAHQG